MNSQRYKTLSSKLLYSHERLELVEDIIELPGGDKSTYLKYDGLRDSACLLVENDADKFLLLNEYTYPADRYIYQMPGGLLEQGETPQEGAERELLEETGYIASNFQFLGTVMQDHRRSKALLNLFYVSGLKLQKQQLEPQEFINLQWFTKKEIQAIIKDNKLQHFGSLAAWGLYLNQQSLGY